ncbi:aromatic ring-hydroxylating oxygenase subunit alpha [Sphingobium boeckii]|uniref:Phenylpropionate dioxygenase-like ring-hydroxylating dioxygenase large terminal subunit n=1 Tax=Sphingobium boeckii TaxID=1082345 RepID=A0A7W9EEM7_9SPHN|nr:aromatic ring-hydroxylating dioxygenase subunit alpha [Sphingobium boeckii]MBB5686342.1 phenylpropionate dioxygenase-like ring-hydroxylating dioxygenase large terminal subunit [Sphingobium boeckii]
MASLPISEPIVPDLTTKERVNASQHPELGTGPIPVEFFLSEEIFQREADEIFGRYWLVIGRSEQVRNSGDYFVYEVEVQKTSVIVAKGKDGKVRAFHNICRHRGNRVASGAGNCRHFVCQNHGWAFTMDGKLASAPDFSQFHDLDKATLGLVEINCEVWNSFIFINFDKNPAQTLIEQLGGFVEQYRDYPFESLVCGGQWSSKLRCNWKVFQDIFQEAYHVSTVHAGTFPTFYAGPINPFGRPGGFKTWGLNRSATVVYNPEYEATPIEKVAAALGTTWTDMATEGFPGSNWSNNKYFAFDINGTFPNILIDVASGFFFTHQFWPISVNETRWVGSVYFLPPRKPSELLSQEQAYILIRDAWREDLSLGEAAQLALESRAMDHVHFADSEIALRHSFEAMKQALNLDL